MTKKGLTKTEKFLKSQYKTRMGVFLPTVSNYRKMTRQQKKVYMNIARKYNSGVSTYKEQALYDAYEAMEAWSSELDLNRRLVAKNLGNRVIDRVDVINTLRRQLDIEYPKDKHTRKAVQSAVFNRAFRSIPKKEFTYDNNDIRSQSQYLKAYEEQDGSFRVVETGGARSIFVGRYRGDRAHIYNLLNEYNNQQETLQDRFISEWKDSISKQRPASALSLFKRHSKPGTLKAR